MHVGIFVKSGRNIWTWGWICYILEVEGLCTSTYSTMRLPQLAQSFVLTHHCPFTVRIVCLSEAYYYKAVIFLVSFLIFIFLFSPWHTSVLLCDWPPALFSFFHYPLCRSWTYLVLLLFVHTHVPHFALTLCLCPLLSFILPFSSISLHFVQE